MIISSIINNDDGDIVFINDFMNFIKQKYYILFAMAIVIVISSYLASVYIAKRKRGIV